MSSEESIIRIYNVACWFRIRHGLLNTRRYTALKNVSLDVRRGETLGIIGRNGAGKSTLLKLMAGILRPNKGTVQVNAGTRIALLSLNLGYAEDLSGRDNAIMGGMVLGFKKSDAVRRLASIAEFSELQDWMDEPIKTYSSGMRARLGFSVAMEFSPEVLLVDETLGVGDERFRTKSTAKMQEKMRSGHTVVFVSHQAPVMKSLCQRVAWLEDGVTRMVGDTAAVLTSYHQWIQRD